MPRTKHISKYPPEYAKLFGKASLAPVAIACDSREQAVNLRNDLYAYRTAARKKLGQQATRGLFAITLNITLHTLTLQGN